MRFMTGLTVEGEFITSYWSGSTEQGAHPRATQVKKKYSKQALDKLQVSKMHNLKTTTDPPTLDTKDGCASKKLSTKIDKWIWAEGIWSKLLKHMSNKLAI